MHTQPIRPLILSLLAAVLLVSGCSQEDPTNQAQDYLNRAEAYRDQGQYRAAMIEATNAINTSPEEVAPALALADIYNRLGVGRRAAELLEGWAETDPQAVALKLAEAYLKQGKFLSAQETLNAFEPQTDEERRRKQLYLADALRIRGDLAESEAAYQALLENYPEDMEIKTRLAENHLYRGQGQQAEALLAELRQAHPEDIDVLRLSAIRALQRNDAAKAEEWLTKAVMLTPDTDVMLPERASVLELLAESLTAQGRTSEALVYQKLLAEESPEAFEAQQRLSEAASAAQAGDYEKAEELLQALLEQNPDSQSAAVMLGMVNLQQGELDQAASLLSDNLDAETARPEAIRAAALAQARTGQQEQALATLDRALEARPDQPVLLALYGLLGLNNPEHEEKAYMRLQKVLAIDPQRGEIRLALARYHRLNGEPEQAMAQLRSAFNFEPANWDITRLYMGLLFNQDDLNEAAEAIETLKQAAPRARQTRLYEAQYQYRNGNSSQAIASMRELTRAEPSYARAFGVLSQMLYQDGQPRPALSALEDVLALQPQNDTYLRAGVEIINEADLGLNPQNWLANIGARHPEAKPNTLGLRAMLLRDRGQLEQAVTLLKSYAGETNDYLRQTQSLVFRDRAMELARAENYSAAHPLLMSALDNFPTSKTLNLDLVRLELAQERYDQAQTLLDDLTERHPGDPEVILLQASAIQAQEGQAETYSFLRQAWNQNPQGELAPRLLSLAKQEDPDAVPQILADWEAVAPNSRARLLFTAEEHQRGGDETAAIGIYEQLVEQNPDDALALNNLAWLIKEQNLPRAIALAERATQLQPDSAAVLDTYGWLLHLQGDKTRAIDYLEQALALAPDQEDIQQNLEAAREAD